jgi:hypothetical protein
MQFVARYTRDIRQPNQSAAETLRTMRVTEGQPYGELEKQLNQTLHAIQVLWTIALLDNRVRAKPTLID